MFIFDYVSILVQVLQDAGDFLLAWKPPKMLLGRGNVSSRMLLNYDGVILVLPRIMNPLKMARLKMIQFFSPGLALSASKLDMLIYEHCCLVGAAVSWAMSRSFLIFGAPLRHLNPWEFCLAWDWNPSKRFANINCFRKSLKNAMARRNAAACFPLNQRMISHRLFTSPLHPGSWWTYQCTLLPWRLLDPGKA